MIFFGALLLMSYSIYRFTILSLANFSSSVLVPATVKATVALISGAEPSSASIFPKPKR